MIARAVVTVVLLGSASEHVQAQKRSGLPVGRESLTSSRAVAHAVTARSAQAPGPAERPSADTAAPLFDTERADVAGLRVGGRAKDFAVTAKRLFGAVSRVSRNRDWYPGYVAALEVNAMQCGAVRSRESSGRIGTVCVTAFLDGEEIVRAVRIERVFPYMDEDTFRATMVQRYGAAIAGQEIGARALGWGPVVDPRLGYERAGPHRALTAHYGADENLMQRSVIVARHIRVTLQLVDADWARGPR